MKKRFRLGSLKALCCLALIASCASGQWLHYSTPGIPRTPDGKPNLLAPTPKTPDGKTDLSGIWAANNGNLKYFEDLGAGGTNIPMLPWAKAVYRERMENLQKGHPSERCLTHGVTDFDTHLTLRRVIQSPGVIAILFEAYNHYRQIFLDGRLLPRPIQPAYLGYSVGHWEGDTLVVDTTGLNDQGWLDMNGHPQTEATHVIERFRRRNFGHIDLEVTIDDAKAYTKPWTVTLPGWDFVPDQEMIESICENEKDAAHLVGK